jgi:hypothetical protein
MSQISTVPRVVIAIVATDEARNFVGCLGSLRSSIFREFSVIIARMAVMRPSSVTSRNCPKCLG